MQIDILKGLSAAQDASGVCIVIDVFRATTTIPCLLEKSADKVIVSAGRDELNAYIGRENTRVVTDHPDVPNRLDNSPKAALTQDLSHQDIVVSTMNGTHALKAAAHCDCVIAGSFVNMPTVIDYVNKMSPKRVCVLAIGHIDIDAEAVEDTICAEVYADVLTGREIDQTRFTAQMDEAVAIRSQEFEDNIIPSPLMADFELCRSIGHVSAVPVVRYETEIYCVNEK